MSPEQVERIRQAAIARWNGTAWKPPPCCEELYHEILAKLCGDTHEARRVIIDHHMLRCAKTSEKV